MPVKVKTALLEMRNGKALGPGDRNEELIEAAAHIVMEILAKIFNRCLLKIVNHLSIGRKSSSHLYTKGAVEEKARTTGALASCAQCKIIWKGIKK